MIKTGQYEKPRNQYRRFVAELLKEERAEKIETSSGHEANEAINYTRKTVRPPFSDDNERVQAQVNTIQISNALPDGVKVRKGEGIKK